MPKVMTPQERLAEELARLEGRREWLRFDRKNEISEEKASLLNTLIMQINQEIAIVNRKLRLERAA